MICANFGVTRGGFSDCRGAWCAGCYTPHVMDCASVHQPQDFHGMPLAVPEDADRFMVVRLGDHTLISFQCEECHSRNIRGISLTKHISYQAFACQVVHANLDAFWSRASKTVSNHVSEARFQIRYGKAMGYDPYPPLGPFALKDHQGMLQAVGMEARSTERGQKPGATVKWSTTRKSRSSYSNIWEASPSSGGDVTFSADKRRYHATRNPMESRWFESFTRGLRVQMGDVTRQDKAYTIQVVKEIV